MSNPLWFDEDYYATQKAAQMNAIGWKDASGKARTDWQPEDWPHELARFNREHTTAYAAYDNFVACNQAGYASDIELAAINVSPNPLFDVSIYLTNLAAHYNQAGFAAPGFAPGQWTAAKALEHLFSNERTSAWEHFKTYGLEQRINPSNGFDTGAYLEARAAASGLSVPELVAALLEKGENPLQDYFNYGKEHGIAAPAVRQPIQAEITASSIWGAPDDSGPDDDNSPDTPGGNGGVGSGGSNGGGGSNSGSGGGSSAPGGDPAPKPDQPDEPAAPPVSREDPYDEIDAELAVTEPEVSGKDGENTQFAATGAQLDPETVITGGADALNTLVMDLSGNWAGFAGVPDSEGVVKPNVTNVGRVVLKNDTADASLNFNAANIDNPEQFDLDNKGSGAISLTGLPASVKAINIKNIRANQDGAAPETALEFAAAPKSLQIGLEAVCAAGEGGAAIELGGIEEISLASYGTGNSVDLQKASGIKKLVVTDGAPLTITDSDGSTIEEYDASLATANVKLGVSQFKDGAVVKGGSGSDDSLVFNDLAGVKDARWENVENIVFNDAADINAAAATGIEKIWQMSGGEVKIQNLTSDALTFYTVDQGNARTCAKTIISGSMGDITWSSCGTTEFGSELTADFVCDATGDCFISLEGKDRLGVASVFEFRQAKGTITIADPNPTDPDSYKDPSIQGVKLMAEQATGLDVTHTGSMKICGALWKVADVKANLTDNAIDTHGIFKLPALPSAKKVDISADRMDVYVSSLGTEGNGQGMDINIKNATDVYLGDLGGASGARISAKIESYGNTEITKIKTLGDVDVAVSGVNIVAEANGYGVNDGFSGASVRLDFSEIHGDVGHANMLILGEALGGSLSYLGARGNDYFMVGGLTGGTTSTVSLGSGADEMVIQTKESIGAGKLAVLNVSLGSGNDILRVYNMNQEGNLLVNVSDASAASDVITKESGQTAVINDHAAANLALKAVNAGFQLDAETVVNKGVFEYGGNAYWIAGKLSGNSAYNVTLVAAEGASAEIFQDDDLVGV